MLPFYVHIQLLSQGILIKVIINNLFTRNKIFNFEKGLDKGHSHEIPKPKVLKPLGERKEGVDYFN